MKNSEIKDEVLLRSILDTINRIEQHKALKSNSDTVFDAIVFNLITIGEAVNKLSTALKEKYPDVPWRQIVAHRNLLIHNYLGINEKIVWGVVENYIPPFKIQIEHILRQLE